MQRWGDRLMKLHIGTKLINAKPMTRQAYNDFRGWTLPADENGADEGYLVEYVDGGKGNTDHYAGYVSWSPADVFDRAYRPCKGMTFGQAIESLKVGQKVARKGWNGKGMWLILIPGRTNVKVQENTPYKNVLSPSTAIEILPHIDMWTTNSEGRRAMLPGWVASQTDMLSEDWEIIE